MNNSLTNSSSTDLIQIHNNRSFQELDNLDIQKIDMKRVKKDKIKNLFDENYQPANFDKAMQFYNSRSYKKKTEDGQYIPLTTFEDTNSLKAFGLGPYFFIEFMRRISWLFVVFSVLEAIRIYINIESNGLDSTTPGFSTYLITSTLGNFQQSIITEYDSYIMAIIPGIMYLMLFCFHISWKKHFNTEIKQNQQNNFVVKPQKFCIEVTGFQEKQDVDQKDLQDIFSQFGKIYEVSLVKRYKNKLSYFQQLDQLQAKIKQTQLELVLDSSNRQELEKLQKQKQQLQQYINTLSIKPKTVSAFIHFQYQKSKVDCLTYFNDHYLFNSSFHSCMSTLCCCCIEDIKPQFIYGGKPIKIKGSQVPNPEQINWLSYQIDSISRFFRSIIACLVIILFLLFSCTALGLCSIYIETNILDCQDTDMTKYCPGVACTDEQKTCYCNKNVFQSISDQNIYNYCGQQLSQIYIAQGIQYVVIIVSTIVNILFTMVVQSIVDFTRPKTKAIGLAIKTTVLTFFTIFNTIFIPLLIYSNIYGFKTTDYTSLLTIISSDLQNAFNVSQLQFYFDFTKTWYINVSPVFTNYLVFDILFIWIYFIYGKLCGPDPEKFKSEEGKILQKNMNEQITQFKFGIYEQFANFNLVLFMGVFFSAGVPIIVPIACLNLFSRYITSRIIIQTQSSKIQGLGQDFMMNPLTFLPFIIVSSSLFGCWMLTAHENMIPPAMSLIPNGQFLSQIITFQPLLRQLYLPYFLIIALITVIWFFFQQTLARFFECIASLCFERKIVVHPERTKSFTEHTKTMNVLTSYNIRNNDQMRNVILNLEKYLSDKE